MSWKNAKECAENTPDEELLQLYLSESDRRNYSDADAVLEEIRNRGYALRNHFTSITMKKREHKS